MPLHRLLPACIILALAAAPAASANRGQLQSLKAISGATPFSGGCGVPGDETPSSEAEPHLAADPRDPRTLVATWQQDRFAVDGGALGNLVASTRDGGETWRTTTLPKLSRCTGGADERASDPWVSIGGDRRVYAAALTFSETAAATIGAAGPTALSAQTSTDGGRTFAAPVSLVNEGLYDDREALTADPRRPGHAYATWVRRLGALGESGVEYFVRTTDGGRTWSDPTPIYAPPPGFLPVPALIEVLPDGSLLNTFLVANGTPVAKQSAPATPLVPWEVQSMRSTDLGATWSAPVRIGTIANPVAPQDPRTGAYVRAFPVISTAVAPDGTAYVVWNEIESHTAARILIASSRDGGRSWSTPRTVRAVASQAFVPAVAVAGDGTVGVSWDDFRNDRGERDAALVTDVWIAHSHDRGATWSETHIAGPYDMLTAPATSSTSVAGRFVGDYQGLVGLPNGFGALFAQAKPAARAGPSDVFFARVHLGALPKLRLAVRPRRVRAGRRVRLRFRVTAVQDGRRRAVRGATVRFAGRSVRTNASGRASMRRRPVKTGVRRVRVRKRGFRTGVARLRVRPRARSR